LTRSRAGIGQRSRSLLLKREHLVDEACCFERIRADFDVDVSPPCPWDAFAIVDDGTVTGANPASAKVTAEKAVETSDEL